MNILATLLKVFGASLALSLGIKYVAPSLHISPTFGNALIGVSLPPLVMVFLLLWLGRKSSLSLRE
ncbi:MAG: hypothetical protein ACKN9E_01705 [Microcystaceae cyanobacterium]